MRLCDLDKNIISDKCLIVKRERGEPDMPYDNFPKDIPTEKIDACVHDVMGKGHSKESSIAICYSSMVEGKEFNAALKEATHKASDKSSDYLVVEDPQMPTTWHLQVKKDGTPDHGLMGAAWAALHEGYRGNKYEGPGKAEALAMLKKMYDAEGMPMPMMKEAPLAVFKQADGKYRWVMVTSSSFKDRDGQIVSQKALEDDTATMNKTGNFGTVDWWHLYGLDGKLVNGPDLNIAELERAIPVRLGTCDFSAMHEMASIESGLFDNEFVGQKFAEHQSELACSRSFLRPIIEPDANGVFHHIATFSRAILPRGKESNLITRFYAAKEKEMSMIEEKVRELIAKFGGTPAAVETVQNILDASLKDQKVLLNANVEHKEEKPPEPEPVTDAPKEKAWFVADMKPEEFIALVAQGVTKALEPTMAEVKALREAQGTAMKESGKEIVTEIAKVAQAQGEIGKRVAALEGETPRAFRASKDGPAPSAELKEKTPTADEKVPYFASFVNGFVLGAPEAPKP